MRAAARLRFSPRRAYTREIACEIGSSSSGGRKSANTLAWCGTEPSPPPTYSSKPRCVSPSTSRVTPTAPRSCRRTSPHASCRQPENATLNLRPKSCTSGWPSRKYASARAYGVTSNACVVHTPATGQVVTLRTELPHASRVVMPAAASRRIRSGVSTMWMKWSCTSWRVVMWLMPSEYSSARSASTSICSASTPPHGILMRCMPGASQAVSGPLVSSPAG